MKRIFSLLILGMFMISLTSAWSINTFNNSLTSENVTIFFGGDNETRYLKIPENTLIINGLMNVSSLEGNYYQENSNEKECSGTWRSSHPCSFTSDGDWGSYGDLYMYHSDNYVYFNYTKINNYVDSSSWKIKDNGGIFDLSLASPSYDCWNNYNNKIILKALSHSGEIGEDFSVTWSCYNGTNWKDLRTDSSSTIASSRVYEEAMNWSFGNVTNPNITINNNEVWSQTGYFNITNKTNNFAESINNYLSTCSFIGGYCYIPLNFTSSSAGNLIYSDLIFNNYGFIENSQTFNNITYETASETFILNMSYDSNDYPIISAILNYNGTEYSGIKNGSGNNIIFYTSLGIPLVSSQIDIPFYWTISLTNSTTTTYYNSTSNNQTINIINPLEVAHSCSTGFSPSMFFDFKDERNLTSHNASINYNFRFGLSGSVYKEIYGSLDNINHFYLCVNSTIHNNYSLTHGEIQYSKSGYAERRFYTFNNQRISNSTINNTLYLLISSSATSFLFDFQDTNLNPYIDKYTTLLRWYPNLNEYKIVEMAKTDDKGETIMRVQTEDVDYRVGLYEKDGSLLTLLNPVRFACISAPCSYSSLVDRAERDYTSFFNVEGSIEFNETTNIWTLIWNDPSQNTDSMNLIVTRERGDSSFIICDVSSSGFTGILTCDSTGYTGTLVAIAYRTASPTTPIFQKIINTIKSPFAGTVGLFFSFILMALLVLIGVYSPIASVILGIVALIPALYMGVITLAIFIAIATLGGIIIHFMKRTG